MHGRNAGHTRCRQRRAVVAVAPADDLRLGRLAGRGIRKTDELDQKVIGFGAGKGEIDNVVRVVESLGFRAHVMPGATRTSMSSGRWEAIAPDSWSRSSSASVTRRALTP